MYKAIDELRKIAQIEGIDKESGASARLKALDLWLGEWLETVSMEQSVIKTNLSSEEDDFLKYYIATQLGDKLMDDCITVSNEKHKIKAEVLAIKR